MRFFRSEYELIHLVHRSKAYGNGNVGTVATEYALRQSYWQRLSGDTWRAPDGEIFVEKRLRDIREIKSYE